MTSYGKYLKYTGQFNTMMHHVALAFFSFVGAFITWVVLVVGGLVGEPLAVIIPFLIFTPVWVAHLIFFLQWRAAIMTDNSKTVRRFDHDCICSSSFMHKYGDGPYVLYSDYAELAAEKDRLAGLLEAECEALREVAREAHAGLVYTYHAYMKPPSETDGRYEESMFVWNLEPEARDMMLPNEQALFDALIKARAALTTSVQACRKCGGTMKPGKATGQMLVGGMPDFPGDKHAVTLTHGGPGKMIDCMKCVECGWSVTSDSEGGE